MIYALTIIWLGLIFIGSSLPGSSLAAAPSFTSFLVHLFEYFILGVLLGQASLKYYQHISAQKFYLAFLVGGLYALSDEIHQLFVPGRNFDPIDLALDAAGLLIGLWAIYWYNKTKQK